MNARPTLRSAAIGATFALAACGHDRPPPQAEAPPALAVRVATVRSAEIPIFREVVGTVRPALAATVSAKATGRILEFSAVPGQRVEAGAPLARLEVNELEAARDRARANLDQSTRELTRYRNLLASGAATQAEFERVEANQQVAEATLREIESTLANATVTAPFAGVITQKFADTGDLAAPGKPLFAIEDSSRLRLEIDVAESLAGTVSLGDTFEVRIATLEGLLRATAAEVAPAAVAASRTFLVKLDLPRGADVRAGQFGRAYLPAGSRTALTAPRDCLFSRGQMDYVFAVNSGAADLRIVRVGGGAGDAGEAVELLAGVAAGEAIVLSPPAELRDGRAVTIER